MNPTEILNGYRNLRNAGVSTADATKWLESKGSSIDEVAAFAHYGPENVQKSRENWVRKKAEIEDSRTPAERALRASIEFMTKNPVGRAATSVIQGLNKGNPLVQAASMIPGMETINDDVINQETASERALDTGAQFVTPVGVTAKGMSMIGKAPRVAKALSKSRVGRFFAGALKPSSMPIEYASAAGAGTLTGAVDPESTVGQIATGLAGGMTGAGVAAGGRSILNNIAINRGESALARALAGSADGNDIYLGRIRDDLVDDVNSIRGIENIADLRDGKVYATDKVISHLKDRRLVDNRQSSEEVARIVRNALFGKNSVAAPGRYPQIQALINGDVRPADVAYVGQHTGDGRTILKGGHNVGNERIGSLGENNIPQGVESSINQSGSNVNRNLNDIVSDRKGYSALQKGIHSSDEFASEMQALARTEIDNTANRVQKGVFGILNQPQLDKNGKLVSEQFKDVGEFYGEFMKEFGDETVDKNKVARLITENPDIKKYIKDAQAKGQYARGKPENSFAVLQDANRRMKMDLRDRMINSSSSLQDKSYASRALDKLLDSRFAGRDYLDKGFRRFKLQSDILDDIYGANYADGSNLAQKLNTSGSRREISEVFGPDIADQSMNYLRAQSDVFGRLKNLDSRAESKLSQVGVVKPFWRENVETVGSMLGSLADFLYGNAVKSGRTRQARDLLSGKKNVADVKGFWDYAFMPVKASGDIPGTRAARQNILYNLLSQPTQNQE